MQYALFFNWNETSMLRKYIDYCSLYNGYIFNRSVGGRDARLNPVT